MKEVLTKSFWVGVKKTFDDARRDPPPAPSMPKAPAELKVETDVKAGVPKLDPAATLEDPQRTSE